MINRSLSPEPKGEITFHLPNIEHLTLKNGLRVLFVKKDKLPLIQTSFLINAGSRQDREGKYGLSHLTAMMIDEGAGPYSSLELDDEIEKLGSVLSISNNHDAFFVSLLTLKEHFERSLELISHIIKNPLMAEKDFQRESQKLKNKLQQMYDDPGYIASTVFEKIILEGSDYSNPTMGLQSSIANISLTDTKNFYRDKISPENSTLIIVGNITRGEIEEKFNELFGDWISGEGSEESSFKYRQRSKKIYLIHKEGAAQSELRIGQRAGLRNSDDFFPKVILNTILGGQFSSRINLNLREDKGYTYGASSAFAYYSNAGMFKISTAVNIENTMDAVGEIFKEIDGIRNNIRDEEIEFAKSYLVKGFPSKFETYGQIANNLNLLVIHKLRDDYFNNYINELKAVEREMIISAANDALNPDDMTILIVGDREKILSQTKNSGIEIIELGLEGNIITS